MAELLTVVGGIASFGQILGLVFRTTEVIVSFCSAFNDAPTELRRIKEKLLSLQISLEGIQDQMGEVNDDELLPPDMCYILQNTVASLFEEVTTLHKRCSKSFNGEPRGTGKRLKWAFVERHLMTGMLERLRDSERELTCVLQLLNVRLSLLIYASQRELHQERRTITYQQKSITNPPLSKCGHHRVTVIGVDSWIRKIGLYGSFSLVSSVDNKEWKSSVCIGFKPPTWISSKSIAIDIHLARAEFLGGGIRILPGSIRLQNQVRLESPFMTACSSGDIKLIAQHLAEGTGQLGDRAICCGKTPLLLQLAIEGQHLDAVQYLLESGADPNVGDDSQILPIFAAAGMSSEKNRFFPQLPPKWAPWLEAFKLLVKHEASVHEVNRDKTLSMLNINYPFREEQTMDYFRILLSEGYIYWETADKTAWSAVNTAIRTRTNSLQALQFLVRNGVNLSRVFDDGRSALHLAAELAEDVEVLEYLCNQGCLDDRDRQDMWGWTPLHYSIIAAYLHTSPDVFQKVRFLLSKGADVNIKGRVKEIFYPEKMPADEFTPGEMCRALSVSLYRKFEGEAKIAGLRLEEVNEGTDNLS
ncbi:hypothetical protein N7462_006242 [Penicillium macrosclerotiorum]|uniref:uncharacterized protein n=1 Tax=Penicillium macrosclerotiorum TaxID=303699 RepID=UPI002549BA81|nr:uncharacterized protein N7462_006242 [Penicillium macrosclerotiorum]KAJ5683077.1 hypothetical protein N7462_006242 [Penicillium macrosclerotiorum]